MQVYSNNIMQHDEAFLSLLSSQRELLNQLNARQQTEQTKQQQQTSGTAGATHGGGGSLVAPDSTGLTNRPITQRRTSMDMLLSVTKRFSMGMGMGYDQSFLPLFPTDPYDVESDVNAHVDGSPKDVKLEKGQEEHRRKKRRLSSLGFISSSFFEDHLKPGRRDSTGFGPQYLANAPVAPPMASDNLDSDPEDDEDDKDEVTLEPLELDQPQYSRTEVKNVMEGFTSSMEISQKSQQAIHDWDRKMGLKRSHSKTMRLSSRSRKKLRATFKKEINALISISKM